MHERSWIAISTKSTGLRIHLPPVSNCCAALARLRRGVWTSIWSGRQQPDRIEPFVPGQVVELRGFLSASAVIDPPLYAAGMEGALLEIGLHSAANMSALRPRQGEAEYFLPRDCRCRVLGVAASRSYRTQDGDHCLRALVQLKQL